MLSQPPAHFPAASTSNPASPTFPHPSSSNFSHAQSLSLNGAGIPLAIRPGTSSGMAPPVLSAEDEAGVRGGRTYLEYIKSWDDEHVARWLVETNVGQYGEVFRSNDIRGNVLLDVDQLALKEMGVRSVGDRVKITVAIKALRQRCVTAAWNERQSVRNSYLATNVNGALPSLPPPPPPPAAANGSTGRLPGRSGGRVPPPLHLPSATGDLPQAWQPTSSRTGSTTTGYLSTASSASTSSPRGIGSPRTAPPPSLPPPRSQPPLAPSISTMSPSPRSSNYPGNTSAGWTGEYGLPRGPSPGNLGGGAFGSRGTSPVPPSNRPPVGVAPARPSTAQPNQPSQVLHRKTGSTGGSATSLRPSTAQPSSSYSHNQPHSTHPYASTTSPTTDGFTSTVYGRPIPASNKSSLLPSLNLSNSTLQDHPIETHSRTNSTNGRDLGFTVGRGGFSKPTTPGGTVSASGPIAGSGINASSLDAVMRKAVKFTEETGASKMIAVSDCKNGREVLVRALRKFQRLTGTSGAEVEELEEWGVFATTSDGRSRLLTETELFAICRDGQAPERQGQRGLQLRRIHKRGQRKLQAFFGEAHTPDSTRPGGVAPRSPSSPNYLGIDIPSTTVEPASPSASSLGSAYEDNFRRSLEPSTTGGERGKMNRASTVSVMSGLGADWSPSDARTTTTTATRSTSSGLLLSSGQKLRNFFGQRPPSELIATHLTEYFPKAENNKLLSKQVRQSMRKSMVRRDSQQSVISGTSWEKAPDSYSLNPTDMSRFSGSSSGSFSHPPPPLPLDKDYPNTPPTRYGGPRSSNDSARSSLHPSLLEPPDENAEDDGDTRSIISSTLSSRRLSRVGTRLSSASGWDRRSKESDGASMLTVDEVTAELETRRASLASYLSESEDEEAPEGSEVRPPSIAFEIEEEDSVDEEEEELSEEEEEEVVVPEAVSSKPTLKWIKGALIGAGSFGSVYLGMNPTSGSLMAVKQVELPTGHSHNEERKKSMLDALEREIELLKVLQHENIVQYLDSSSDATHLNIFLEYVPGGSVAALLSNYGAFEEALVSKFVRQILTGLEYLHEREIIHRDIKGANILVDNKGGIKISDFGISKKVEDNLLTGSKVHRPSLQGSVYWMAPEVVKQTAYTSKADIWSLGCLVVEMLTGTHPWANLTQMQAIFRIGSSVQPTIPDDISIEADDFLEQTFLLDYNDRPSARALLLHAFIRDPEDNSQQTPTRETFSQSNSPVKPA